ncbi:DUF938 domain-containing protein [Rhodovulum steppense]|uniref:Uncharacterized protein DUF938 n=1 Tax=Rhodovulum steppense TaxID=540251 RepID=A0A4R1YX59_9RHOB|nr:DUF938 domain-containing protein [Rhodovulum steppense]TCM85768.1 uncharacterized protein DUF938 [Rhodovulum steppense]
MSRRLSLPDSASVAQPGADGRMHAPSAARNAAAICAVIAARAPQTGRALEIASGTGEHAVRIAAELPGLDWQPTEIDPARRGSIDAWAAHMGLANIRPAIALDACAPGWGGAHRGQDLIFASNILHLVSQTEAETLVREAGAALAPGGVLMIYGPFRRDEGFASAGDAAFHASLVAQDPAIGYKGVGEVADWMRAAGLYVEPPVEMPANNLTLIAARPPLFDPGQGGAAGKLV